MRFSLVLCCAIFVILLANGGNAKRQKRFLRRDFLNPLSDSLLGIGEYARGFSDQLMSQASMAVRQALPQVNRAVSGIGSWGTGVGDQVMSGFDKRARPVEREIEGEEEGDTSPGHQEGAGEVPGPPKGPGEVSGSGQQPFVPFSFSFGFLTPWWDGPNVCVEKSEIEEPEQDMADFSGFSINFQTTRCVPSETSYVCTRKLQANGMRKTVVVRRQCCHGFVRRTDKRPGCSALKMENLVDTMKSLEMNKFVKWIGNAGLTEKLMSENLTVFAPSNEGIVDFEDDTEDNEISAINPAKRLTDVTSIVARHIAPGFENIDILENEQLINTIDDQTKIRINKYQQISTPEVVTANCIPISGKNNFATNGIVHLVSGVLPQPQKSLGEIIEDDEKFSKFKELLTESGLLEELKKDSQPWTLFVPTNEAFGKLPRGLRKQIDAKEGCVESILQQHIVKGTICTSAVVTMLNVDNILHNALHLTKDENEKLRVDGAAIESQNLLGTNGVIHVVEKVLIPTQARSLLKALEEEERSDILDLIELSDMVSKLEEAQNVTFFVPSKEAFEALSNETKQEMLSNPEFAKRMLQNHLVESHLPSSTFADNKKIMTLNGHGIHMKLHEGFPGIVTAATVQCAYIVLHDNQVCGATLHKINKVLLPPKGSIVEA
ncbi:hypothetical protein JTE90_013960 [Oedothorax gibbosus]|uniref:FAS1 domain-containing protein n=1 Tax=Oedothorax gibbosus TaxID=931172 RepID=A0AAV6UCW0_9ARAC|nr:hypothetical protein JTE90_013960 [Oedothorax gibbosus]